ncbi:MAG: hypothetical protein O3A00_15465, partial [Planctomycetota bacterium]|nr:hypothetical protein [Planctomycetota bacterium]
RVSPLEEMELEAVAVDDFGVRDFGVSFSVAGQPEKTVVIGNGIPAKESRKIDHLLSMESLDAEPDQLVSYFFFADDFGPNGKLRRTFSDMYFAEVRHFEEIYREGQQPPAGGAKKQQQGGGSPKQQQMEKLNALQKQIINATWTLIRRETSETVSDAFAKDVKLLVESQQAALKQASDLDKKIEDAESKVFIKTVIDEMTKVVESLEQATAEKSARPLRTALTREQSAYQALLKLRAREHKVVQQQQQQGGGGGGKQGNSRSQKQLNQLELNNKQNRYEAQKSAAQQSQQSAAQREQLQVLNRLRELARRQSGIVEKLKEMEHELRLAKTEAEKEAIRRRLKRLRDEQQQMLRDVDELRDRMDKPESQQQLAESKKQLEQTRKKVLQASDALKRGQVSQALNAGTRAQRDLEDLKNDVRKKTANQFSDEMRELRERTRELSERQQQLSRKLDENRKQRSLRYAKDRQQIEDGLRDQQGKVDGVLDDMKRLVQKAESSEPLLSKQLYDSIRKARADNPQEDLDAARKLVNRGLLKEAGQAEQQARRGIDNLKDGLEKAAKGVLGDQGEALNRARREIDGLKKELQDEIAKADPRGQASPQKAAPTSQPYGAGAKAARNGKPNGDAKPVSAGSKSGSNGQPKSGDQSKPGAGARGKPSNAAPNGNSKPSSQGGQPQGANPGANGGSKPQAGSASPSNSQAPGKSGTQANSKSPGKAKSGNGGGQGSGGQSSKGAPNAGGQSKPSLLSQGGMQSGPGGGPGQRSPLTGEGFREWSDRLRDVEEMLDDPKLRADVAKIRDRARSIRAEFKRHATEPNWNLVRKSILQPMVELETRIANELARQEPDDKLVPIDRDPVPDRFSELVKKYYEGLGKGRRATRLEKR